MHYAEDADMSDPPSSAIERWRTSDASGATSVTERPVQQYSQLDMAEPAAIAAAVHAGEPIICEGSAPVRSKVRIACPWRPGHSPDTSIGALTLCEWPRFAMVRRELIPALAWLSKNGLPSSAPTPALQDPEIHWFRMHVYKDGCLGTAGRENIDSRRI